MEGGSRVFEAQEECTPMKTKVAEAAVSRPRISSTTSSYSRAFSPSFVIEGNIGVGKSTLLNLCQEDDFFNENFKIFVEPIDQWQKVNGTKHNILEAFYKDPKGMAYLFQNFVFITRFLQHQKAAIEGSPRLLERSVWTDKFAFAAAVSETKLMTSLEFEVYKAWYEPVVEVLPNLVPNAFIYLRADPEVCFKRLKTRNRQEESNVPLDYLQLLHSKHESWFIDGADVVEDGEKKEEEMDAKLDFVTGTHLRRLVGSRTHRLLDGVPVLVVDCNRHLKEEERVELRKVVMNFVTGDLRREFEVKKNLLATPRGSTTAMQSTNLGRLSVTSMGGQGLPSPVPEKATTASVFDFERRIDEARETKKGCKSDRPLVRA